MGGDIDIPSAAFTGQSVRSYQHNTFLHLLDEGVHNILLWAKAISNDADAVGAFRYCAIDRVRSPVEIRKWKRDGMRILGVPASK
jgi:hypothetical protein